MGPDTPRKPRDGFSRPGGEQHSAPLGRARHRAAERAPPVARSSGTGSARDIRCHLLRHTKKILRGRFHLLLRMSPATVVALSSAIKVQDRWKGSIVVCKYKVSSGKRLVVLNRYPPAQVCLPVVKRTDGKGPALCLEAPGSVSSGCPAGVAARAVWWGESGARRDWGRLWPVPAGEWSGSIAEQCLGKRLGTIIWHTAPPWGSRQPAGQGLGGLPPFMFLAELPFFWGGMYICKWHY
ncbi:PREDICTED: uncharacterized protein LOC103903570 [Aptenodytes forsteri]|uniref:uncharacterized protein LOC103903570 n=1 Tax=Aptenodytes forsteri TaxID=9233 RepID=UPI0004F49A76|nr:PREDICTED: uncharacterized protein LOC103903570 [Aptenodytes forsteri]